MPTDVSENFNAFGRLELRVGQRRIPPEFQATDVQFRRVPGEGCAGGHHHQGRVSRTRNAALDPVRRIVPRARGAAVPEVAVHDPEFPRALGERIAPAIRHAGTDHRAIGAEGQGLRKTKHRREGLRIKGTEAAPDSHIIRSAEQVVRARGPNSET